ncbi:MAG: class I SAM-dependent methyltransferase, partial [Deltaproteobacteria bacterium]|nr:class I SAM-dependent methyltransferase [Deltaproteobacteria bacterium]
MEEGEENLGDWRNTWGKREFIQRWVAKGGWQGPIRQLQTDMVLRMIPHALEAPIRVLDLGAGYGALAGAVLNERPHATAVCLDVSMEMLELGKERNKTLEDRIMFIQGSLENPDWLKMVEGTFDAVISSRALHHFTANQRRRDIFKEAYEISRAGGCFINADNVRAPTASLRERFGKARDEWLDRQVRESSGGKTTLRELKASSPSTYHGPHDNGRLDEELAWLKEAGFEDVDCFWKLGTAVVYG